MDSEELSANVTERMNVAENDKETIVSRWVDAIESGCKSMHWNFFLEIESLSNKHLHNILTWIIILDIDIRARYFWLC